MPRNDTDHRPIGSSQKPGNRDRCKNAYARPQQTSAGPNNCQVDEEGGGGAPRGDVRALGDRQPVTLQTTPPLRTSTTTPPSQQFVKPGPPIPQRILDDLDFCSVGDFQHSFTRQTLTWGKVPPLVRSFCQKSGRLREDCPHQRLPELKKLADMTRSFTKIHNNVCQDVTNACAVQPQEEGDRQGVLHKLQSSIPESHKDANPTLYGSLCKGFGLARCDLDICLTFNSSKDGNDISHVRMIKYLARKFHKHPEPHKVIAITNAKVAIIQLFLVQSGLEADISLYNGLSQQRTRLLKMYSSIDNRVRERSYTIKRFAKTCDICDASRGSLSSYAYILMTLYYPHKRKPPVIPVLQELNPEREPKPDNNGSVGELWLGMLRFYMEEFNFKKHVVCIRQKAPLTKLRNMWNSWCIAIEDPFDMHPNLGLGVSYKTCIYIMTAFIKFLLGVTIDKLPATYSTHVDCLFCSRQLTDGQRPNDRECPRSGTIGHSVKVCPRRPAPGTSECEDRNTPSRQRYNCQG
ncbi:terminal uridylyltransferase 7-like [Haemaphysalis longicornis]